jgi:hypothetical protein
MPFRFENGLGRVRALVDEMGRFFRKLLGANDINLPNWTKRLRRGRGERFIRIVRGLVG